MSEEDSLFSPVVVCGLHNLGNTCYFNAGLQCMANSAPFVTAMRFYAQSLHLRTYGALRPSRDSRQRLCRELNGTLYDMEHSESPTVAPSGLLRTVAENNPQFEGLQQQDSPELINTLLAVVDDETNIRQSVSPILASASSRPAATGAATELNLLRFMKTVNDENLAKDQKLCAAKGKESSFRPPYLLRSTASNIFQGYLLSEVTCSSCNCVSRVVEAFTSLTVEIPTYKQRAAYRRDHPRPTPASHRQRKRSMNPFTLVANCFAAVFKVLCCCCFGEDLGQLTLDECLDIHFAKEALTKYTCEVCGVTSTASKKLSLLRAPENLIVHIKRFEYGYYWTTKKHDDVEFELQGSTNYNSGADTTERDEAPEPFTPVQSDGHEPGPAARDWDIDVERFFPPATDGSSRSPFAGMTNYSLEGVVNHHGGFGGGHYTAYTRKGSHGWVLCNDSMLKKVTADEVAESQAYVMVFKKSATKEAPTELEEVKAKAQSYLARRVAPPADPEQLCYVSRQWLLQAATFEEPGLMMNDMCYCDPKDRERCLYDGGAAGAPATIHSHFHCPAAWFYVPVCRGDFELFQKHYGCGPSIDHATYTSFVEKEGAWLSRR